MSKIGKNIWYWDSVRDSAGGSVYASVAYSARDSIYSSVMSPVWDSVHDSGLNPIRSHIIKILENGNE